MYSHLSEGVELQLLDIQIRLDGFHMTPLPVIISYNGRRVNGTISPFTHCNRTLPTFYSHLPPISLRLLGADRARATARAGRPQGQGDRKGSPLLYPELGNNIGNGGLQDIVGAIPCGRPYLDATIRVIAQNAVGRESY